MARYGIDAPTLVHLVDKGLEVDRAHQLVAPHSIRSDALQLLLDDVRAGRRTDREALALHQRMTELKLRVLGDRVSRGTAWELARAHDWDSLDGAEYLAVTRLQADALVTVDREMRARAKGIVPTAPIRSLLARP